MPQKNVHIFGASLIDEKAISQIHRCISEDDIAVLTADAHYGYGHPIGGAVAYRNKISLSGVGFDIGCGNKAVRTNIMADDINIAKIMDQIFRRISFGIGRPNNELVHHGVIDQIATCDLKPLRKMAQMAASQLGTVGAGNHFVDLFKDDDGYLWIGVHFGSRGFGHKTAMGFMALSQGLGFEEHAKEGSMDALPILFDLDTTLGQDYLAAMHLAGDYAYAGRDVVVNKVLEILGASATFEVHNHHNFAWHEEHFGEKYWVVRKGCTPAFPGQQGFIGANMLDTSVIVEGVDTPLSRQGLFSTVHGAGRVMSRRAATGKTACKLDANGKKRQVIVAKGKIDFDAVQQRVKSSGIELRGAGADEAPDCYKKLDEVLHCQAETIKVLYRLHPIGVAMAGNNIIDPYKD